MASAGVQTGESLGLKAVSLVPVVGPLLASIANTVLSIFGSIHAEAVQKEASVINQYLPVWINAIITTMQQLQAGQITEADAITSIQTAAATYLTNVRPIIKIDKACASDAGQSGCTIGGQPSNAFPQSLASIGTALPTNPNCCNTSQCNAACSILCSVVSPTTQGLIKIINAGGGTWVINGTRQNGAIAPTPAVTIVYKKPSVLDQIDREVLAEIHLSSSITGGSNVVGNIELASILGVAGIVVLFIIVLGHRSAA